MNVVSLSAAGRVLFGRSEIHQVAEKRRGKIEEFCQVLATISIQPSLGQASIVTRELPGTSDNLHPML